MRTSGLFYSLPLPQPLAQAMDTQRTHTAALRKSGLDGKSSVWCKLPHGHSLARMSLGISQTFIKYPFLPPADFFQLCRGIFKESTQLLTMLVFLIPCCISMLPSEGTLPYATFVLPSPQYLP